MDSSYVDLLESEVEWVKADGDTVTIRFSKAFIIKTSTGSEQSTRWYQAGNLIFHEAEVIGELVTGPLVCAGGDVVENVYTYRDMIPIPLKSSGHASCDLHFKDCDAHLIVNAVGVTLDLEDRPYYIEHFENDGD